jgi:MFS family permease
LGAVILLLGAVTDEPASRHEPLASGRYDWGVIAQVLAPSLIIGIGAGLSIPFISLFFKHAFELGYQEFSLLSSATTLLVSIGSMLGPRLQERYGYKVAIIWTQSIAVLALALLGVSELFAPGPMALTLASVCYLLRQPLMNLANPVISELTMNAVGPRNRELTSALKQAIWAASWFFSTLMFRGLRDAGYSYVWVFGSTAALYAVGVIWYALLIRRFEQQGAVAWREAS